METRHIHDTERDRTSDGYYVICVNCEKEFEAKRYDASFCSNKCRTAHHRKLQQLDKDIDKTFDMVRGLIARMPGKGESKTFIKLNELSAVIDRALAWVEID